MTQRLCWFLAPSLKSCSGYSEVWCCSLLLPNYWIFYCVSLYSKGLWVVFCKQLCMHHRVLHDCFLSISMSKSFHEMPLLQSRAWILAVDQIFFLPTILLLVTLTWDLELEPSSTLETSHWSAWQVHKNFCGFACWRTVLTQPPKRDKTARTWTGIRNQWYKF